jgi:lipoprotein signal peptidase
MKFALPSNFFNQDNFPSSRLGLQWFVFVIFLDQLTKFVAGWQGRGVILNSGISLGLGSQVPPMLTTAVLALVWIFLAWGGRQLWRNHPVAGALILGGGFSNLIDRLLLGGVRDWLLLPLTGLTNNLADWALFVGLAILFWQIYNRRGQLE